MSVDLSRPHFTIILDERMGNAACLSEASDGELYIVIHPEAAEDDSPARSTGHAVFRAAVNEVMQNHRNGTTPTAR